jgi:hypothetical protein
MATIAECPFCNEILSPDDFRHGPKSTCPRCGNSITRPARPPGKAASLPNPDPSPPPARRPKPPPRPSVTALDADVEEQDEETPDSGGSFLAQLRRLDPGTLAVFLLGSTALVLASVPGAAFLTRPLSALALLVALACALTPPLRQQANLLLLGGLSVLCLFTWIFMGPKPPPRDPPRPTFVAVPLQNAGMVGFKPVKDDEWVDADLSALQRDDVRVRIRSVKTGVVEMLQDKKPVFSPTEHLQIRVQVSYEGAAHQPIPFATWADGPHAASKHPPTLTDNLGHPYAQTRFEPTLTIVGRGPETHPLTPGRMIDDLLIYPVPPPQVEFLRLELPGSAVGATGSFRFRIPRSMIQAAN